MGKTLFLTGGAGMVGRNIRFHAAASQWDIVAPSSSELDLTDTAKVRRFIRDLTPDAVVHAAGRVGGIQANMSDPVGFLDINTMIGRNVIAESYAHGVPVLINLASTCIYPAAAPNPLVEEAILTGTLEPTNEGYALAKIMALRLCEYIRRQAPDRIYKTLIPCNLYGLYDKFDPARSHLVPAIIHKIHAAKVARVSEVEIWGDGTARREFMFAADLADAVLRALDRPETLPDLMNVGPGADHSINDYYQSVADVIGWSGRFVHDLTKPVGMKRKLTSCVRQSGWGWHPATSLQDGLAKTYDHYLKEVVQ